MTFIQIGSYFFLRSYSIILKYIFILQSLCFLQSLLLTQNTHQQHLSQQRSSAEDDKTRDVEIMSETQPLGPTATPVHCHSMEMQQHSPTHRDIAGE